MPRKTDLIAEEASVSSPLRRSSRINVSANSPAPSTLTSKKNIQFDTEVPEAPKARRASVTQENSENDEKKENRGRGRRASTTKEEPEQKPEPAKPRSRRSSATAEPSVKEEEKRKPVTRRRRSSAAEEPPESELGRPVRSRRSSATDTREEDDIAKKAVRGRRGSVQKEEPEEEPVRKSLRNRKDPVTEKTEEALKIETKEKRPTRGRRSSTDRLEDEQEIKTIRLTPSKSRRRLSTTENTLSLEPIKELESEIISRKSDSPIKTELRVILDPSPVKEKTPEKVEKDLKVTTDKTKIANSTPSTSKNRLLFTESAVNLESVDKLQQDVKIKKGGSQREDLKIVLSLTPKRGELKETKTNLDLSVIDESSFTETNPKESSEPPQEGIENTLQQPEMKSEMKNDNISEQNASESNTVDGVSKSDCPNISMGSDGFIKLHLNISLLNSTSENLSQRESIEEDDTLNTSNTSSNSNKENIDTNSSEDLNETEYILENKENLISTDSHDNCSEPKVETPIVVARISNVFRPKMIDNSFSEPMDVDQSPSILGTTQNKISLALEESAKSTPVAKKHLPNIEIEESSIAAEEQETKPSTKIVHKRDNEVAESDSEDESFKLSLSISRIGQPEDSKDTPQIEDKNSTLGSECTDEDPIIEVCDEGPSKQSSINDVAKNAEAPEQTTDLEKSNDSFADSLTETVVLKETEYTSDKKDQPKIQENSLFKQEMKQEPDAEYADKSRSPLLSMGEEIKPELKDLDILEKLPGKQDEEADEQETELIKVKFEENISSGKLNPQPLQVHIQDELKIEKDENLLRKLEQSDMECSRIQERQFQEIESAKLVVEESRPFKKSKSPQLQYVRVQDELEENPLDENNIVIEGKQKLESRNPQRDLDDDDNTKISKSTEKLNTEINQATENGSPHKLRDVQLAKSSPSKHLDANLEYKPKQPEKQLMETEELRKVTENVDEESNQTNENSLLEKPEDEIEVASTSPKKSISPREVTPEPKNQLPITEFPHHELGSHFKTAEEYELLKISKSPQPEEDENTSRMLSSPLVEDTELQSNNETEVTSISRRKSDTSTSNDTQRTEFDQKSESPLSEECTEKKQLPELELAKESCESDEYEFAISSDDEDLEATQQLDLEQGPIKGESALQLLEIATNEAQSKILTSPLQREITNTEDIENKDDISPEQSEATVLMENTVNKDKDFEEDTDKTDEYDKMESLEDEIQEKSLNISSHVVDEATSKLAEANTVKDPSIAKLEATLNKESQEKETQDEAEDMANYDENRIIEDKANINITTMPETNEGISASMNDGDINENKEKSQDMIKNITDISGQPESNDSTMEDPLTEYKEMEADFKDVTQDYQEQRSSKKKLKRIKKSLMKKPEESNELDNQKEQPGTSGTRKKFEKRSSEETDPSYSSKESSDIDVLETEKKQKTKRRKKKRKQNKTKEDCYSFVSTIYENGQPISCGVTRTTLAFDVSKTEKKIHLQNVADVSEDIVESSNKLAHIVSIESEPNKIETDSENKEKKQKTSRNKSKKVKMTLKETEESIKNVTSPIKKSKISEKKQKQKVTDADTLESIDDAEFEENEVEENLANVKTAAKSIETVKTKKPESNKKKDFENEIPQEHSNSKGDKDISKKIPLREEHEDVDLSKSRSPKRKLQKEDQAEVIEEAPSSKKKLKKSQKKTKVSELGPAKKQSRELTQSYEDKDNTEIPNSGSKHRKRKADETSRYKNVGDIEKKRKKIENKTESDSDEINFSPQEQPVEQTALEEFTNPKLDDYLSKKISEMENEEEGSYTDASQGQEQEDTDREENEFICSMAEEGEEDTPSEDSNAIIDEGESINTTESETEPDDDYDEDDSFICDEEAEELLSGSEYDLGDERKKKKSRIIPIDDYEDDIIKVERKKKPIKKKKSRIIVITDSSEDENEKLESHGNKHIEEDVKFAPPSAEPSTLNNDNSYSEEQIIDVITVEASPDETVTKPGKSDVATHTLDAASESEEKNEQKRRKSSITIHENISVTEIKDAALSQRISSLVDTFCTSIQKGQISMNLSLQYATKEASETSSQNETDDVFVEGSKQGIKSTPLKMSSNKLEESDESESKENASRVEKVSPDKLKSAQFVTTDSSSVGSSLNVNDEESNTEEDMASKKAERLSISLDNIEDLDASKKKLKKKRRLSKSLEDLHKSVHKKKKKTDKAFEKTKKDLTMKKKIKNPRRANKFKKQSSSESNLQTQTLSIMNQLITDVKNRPIRTIKPSRDMIDMNGSWITEIANVRPSTSLVSRREMTEYKAGKVHPKDFRKQMLYDSTRIKRVDTKTLLKKKGAYF